MRRRPQHDSFEVGPHETVGPNRPPSASFEGDVIIPFLVSGGVTFFAVTDGPPVFDARMAGVQLCTHLYVPKGHVAFVKELRCAPFIPPELADPFNSNGVNPLAAAPNNVIASWRSFDGDPAPRAAGTNGVWTTPFGWESYWDDGSTLIPHWEWFLRLIPGDPIAARPPFSFTDASTWFLQPNIPVPLTAYPMIPGQQPSGFFGPQRMQVLQGDKLSSHILVPENTTIALFTKWQQSAWAPRVEWRDAEGDGEGDYGPAVFPLLPSFGQLHGYLQSMSAEPSTENARYGWGG